MVSDPDVIQRTASGSVPFNSASVHDVSAPPTSTAPVLARNGRPKNVCHTITHSTEVVTLTQHPVTHRTSAVTVRTNANLADGQFTLETPEELVLLQRVNGEWEIRV